MRIKTNVGRYVHILSGHFITYMNIEFQTLTAAPLFTNNDYCMMMIDNDEVDGLCFCNDDNNILQ